jgi:hypothetical protein
MFKQFPIKLSVKILFAGMVFLLCIHYFVFPLYVQFKNEVITVWSILSGSDKQASLDLEKERAILAELEGKVVCQTDPTKKSAAYYDFLQETLKKHEIQAANINSGDQITAKNVRREDFSIKFSGTYHIVGMLACDLENGPFFCSVKSLHIVSKSLLSGSLEADMGMSFYRLVK